MICLICNTTLSRRLDSHILEKHQLKPNVYYYTYILGLESPPHCANPDCSNTPNFRFIKEGYKKFCSISCQMSYNMKQRWNQEAYRTKALSVLAKNWENQSNDENYRKQQSIAQKKRWLDLTYAKNQSDKKRKQWRDDHEYRTKMETILRGNIANLWKDKSFRKQHAVRASNRLLKKWQDPDYRAERIEQSRQRMLEWWNDPIQRSKLGHYIGSYQSSKSSKTVLYRSFLELNFYKQLDSNNDVLSYEVEPYKIDYQFEGEIKGYYPDVLITYKNGEKQLVELKPVYYLDHPVNIAKFNAAKDFCDENGLKFVIKTELDVYGKSMYSE